ncbi:Tyrosinase-like protein orsC [Lasiodiplodia hormozganensis]|uniref:Tyrosinase-like protein orsC n=1 Tax=Lasiodiplodia hormozganensis TaxID=869390 RepID=A0AA39YU96_9PEZI|nr:Tyrosinase-like protein orsC [Lasiodiplodia hormozganensis]
MTLLKNLLAVLALVSFASAKCSDPPVRKEWRKLSDDEKKSYIDAVKCLQTKSARTTSYFSGARTRYDDFVALHINATDYVHFVGHFQAWHRYYVASYESALRNECGWTGGQPYWDWTLDATEEDFLKAPVFDPVTGFGGNGYYIDSSNDTSVRLHIPGKTGGGCVTDGPFRNYTVNMGPNNSTAYNPRCLTRDISPWLASQKLNMTMVDRALAGETFQEFDIVTEGQVNVDGLTYHGGGHLGVGGELGAIGDLYNSPSDPLFFFHHANMDRIWWTWEKRDFATRVKDISGPDTQFAYPFNFYGDVSYQNITLDYQMHVGHASNSSWVRVGDVMDIQDGVLCYEYDELY